MVAIPCAAPEVAELMLHLCLNRRFSSSLYSISSVVHEQCRYQILRTEFVFTFFETFKKHLANISAFFANVFSLLCLYHWQTLSLLTPKSRTGAGHAYSCFWYLENALPRAWSLAEREELHLPLPMPPRPYNLSCRA